MRKKKWFLGLLVIVLLPVSALTVLFTAGAAPVEQQAGLTVQMTGATQEGGREISYSITLVNSSSSEIRDVYVTGSIPDGAEFSAATATPTGAVFQGVENGAAAWVSESVPAGGRQGPFTYTVTVSHAPAGGAHAWIRWLQPSEGIAMSGDVTWEAASAAGGPRRGCLSCHVLVDSQTGRYTLAFEAQERAEVDYGLEHPTVAPDGTSITATDETGPDVCLQCHRPDPNNPGRGVGAPITLRDIVHPAHMFSSAFTEHYNGSCFTCHNVRGDGAFELLGSKVETNEKGVPRALLRGEGGIPGAIPPSEGTQ